MISVPRFQPAFRVHRNGVDQAGVVTGVITPVQFNSIAGDGFDTHGYFDLAVNYRYTPRVAGLYLFGVQTRFNYVPAGGPFQEACFIYKNGVNSANGLAYHLLGAGGPTAFTSCLLRMNGLSDYVDFQCFQISGANQPLTGAAVTTFAWGQKVMDWT